MANTLVNSLQRYLTRVISRVNQLRAVSGIVTTTGNAYPMRVEQTRLTADVTVVETDQERTAVMGVSDTGFIDTRGPTVWQHINNSWVSRIYNGNESWLRPGTLVYSNYNKRMYYCDQNMNMTRVNLSTTPVQR